MAQETVKIDVLDKDGNVVYTKSGLTPGQAASANYVDTNNYPLQLPLSGDTTIKATISGGASAGPSTVGVVLLIENN